jgi:LuxR family maltose regulon positive regulatory protein
MTESRTRQVMPSQQDTVEPAPLLETKLYVPRSPRALVPRPRLRERMDRGATSRLMLVSAPAGFGKTTVLAEWLTASLAAPTDHRSVAWLSLDPSDNHPGSFWTYVIAALRSAAPGVGASALALLHAAQPPPIETVLTTLVNELGAVTNDVVLVLDDYHVIDARDVQEGMAFLLDHLPAQLHLVIGSRADPALPLARLRVRGELVEIRAADLRFTPDEAAAYLNGVMGLALTAQDMAALEGRTEGWIAALQLAALSMQGRDDVAGFIAGFAGDDRYVVDYLVEEVLQRQPDRVHTFLLQTSILGRLSGPLCDAVTGQDGGKAMLEALDRGNLFLVPLDDRRRWYRYHHLFADVLRARLLDERPDLLPELHRRASDWYEQNGERAVAIEHALAAEDFQRAADLVELAIPAIRRDLQVARAHKWLQALPDALLHSRPVLSVAFAGTLLAAGELEAVEARLRDAERWLDQTTGPLEESDTPSTPMVVIDDEEFRRLPTMIAVYRAARALSLGDVESTMAYARRALDLVVDDDHLGRGAAAGLLGIAAWATGDLVAAHESYSDCMVSLQRAGHIFDVFVCGITLADIRIAQGRLRDAMRAYEQALRLAPEQGGSLLPGTADMYVGMSALHRERDDLAAAMEDLLKSQELAENTGLPVNRYRWWVAMARIREAEGDLDDALVHLDEAERLYVGEFSPNVRPVPAMRARVWAAQGRFGDVFGWVREQGLSAEDDLSYLREFEHITLARALLARYKMERAEPSLYEAIGLLERLLNAAQEGGRTGSVIEILVLQALAHQMLGDITAALVPLERALTLAEPEGYVRIFVDEGLPMAVLQEAAVERGISPSYVRRLLSPFGDTEDRAPAKQNLIERLSERELDVLRLLATDLDGPDIARQLVVSLNTIRTHTKNIYAKLGVNNRRTAVRRAEELDLLRPRRSGKPPPS